MPHVSLNVTRSGLTIGERRKSLSKILNHQRSITMVSRKITSAKMYNHNRLVGGTDVPEEPEEIAPEEKPMEPEETTPEERPIETSLDLVAEVPSLSLPSPLPIPPTPPSTPVEEVLQPEMKNKDLQNKQSVFTNGPCCSCISRISGPIGDRKVDEIIECIHQNLTEAGKALATLGENFEHDLKLMFVDILGRIQQWTGIVQNKLDVCRNEVNNVRKELLARICEIDVKTREVTDLKAQIAEHENSKMVDERIEEEESIRDQQAERPPKTRLVTEDTQALTDKRIAVKDAVRVSKKKSKDRKDKEDEEVVEDVEEDVEEVEKDLEEVSRRRRYEQQAERPPKTRLVTEDTQALTDKRIAVKDAVRVSKKKSKDRKDKEDEEVVEEVEKGLEEVSRRRRYDEKERDDKEERDNDIAYPSIAVQTSVREKERMKRESELESEVMRLRKENDRIVKERAEYENAIQRALLRGVSSLNVETLKVLHCPPVSCCTSCAPCSTTTSVPSESVVSCPARSAKKRPGSIATTVCNAKILHDRNGRHDDQAYCITRQSCVNPCCRVSKSRKAIDSNLILLRQGDAGKLFATDEKEMPICGSLAKRIEIPLLPRFRM